MIYLVWFIFELVTGGGSYYFYVTDHPILMIVSGVLCLLGLVPILGDDIGDIIGALISHH